LTFPPSPLFADADERAHVIARFRRIVGYFEAIETTTTKTMTKTTTSFRPYNRPALVRLTFDYARSPISQDRFLAFFFRTLGLGMVGDEDGHVDNLDKVCADLREPVLEIAQFLMANFFLPHESVLALALALALGLVTPFLLTHLLPRLTHPVRASSKQDSATLSSPSRGARPYPLPPGAAAQAGLCGYPRAPVGPPRGLSCP